MTQKVKAAHHFAFGLYSPWEGQTVIIWLIPLESIGVYVGMSPLLKMKLMDGLKCRRN